ncbi:hypothetical protein JYK17_17620 [Streptomyces sp. KC 17012]|uniref:hypothetical protein n=1 Tax=Streptomyces plumbidurans TaxID=2814589 RepID=UPI001C9D7876|nr:hypothetical protein [Streptomyces plumbidurans]MBY8341850.1 hypothetical protein [Streptomyces plumbidurans]
MNDQTETADRLAARFETIRRTMAVVAADRPTPEQIAGWNAADREMAERIRVALPGVPLHHVYAVLRALRARQSVDAAGVAPAADQTDLGTEFARQADQPDEAAIAAFEATLPEHTEPKADSKTARRDRYAEVMARADGWAWAAGIFPRLSTPTADRYRRCADAVMAVADAEQAELRARIATLEHVAAGNKRHVQLIVPDLEKAQAVIERVRGLAVQARDHTAAGLDDYQIGRRDLAVDILAALDGIEPAAAPAVDRAGLLQEAIDGLTSAIRDCPASSGQCLSCEAKAAAIRVLRRLADETQQPAAVVTVHAAPDLSPAAQEALGALVDVAKQQAACDFPHPHPEHPCGRRDAAEVARAAQHQAEQHEHPEQRTKVEYRADCADCRSKLWTYQAQQPDTGDNHSCAESGCTGEPGPEQRPAAAGTDQEPAG